MSMVQKVNNVDVGIRESIFRHELRLSSSIDRRRLYYIIYVKWLRGQQLSWCSAGYNHKHFHSCSKKGVWPAPPCCRPYIMVSSMVSIKSNINLYVPLHRRISIQYPIEYFSPNVCEYYITCKKKNIRNTKEKKKVNILDIKTKKNKQSLKTKPTS